MSKKRKTRKQKEAASSRHVAETQVDHTHHVHAESPTYSISGIKPSNTTPPVNTPKNLDMTFIQKDAAYLRHDMTAITAASGIVAAFEVLLFVLLSTGFVHLNFLGY